MSLSGAVVAHLDVALDVALRVVALSFQQHDLLLHGHNFFRLAIVVLEAVAAHAAAILEEFLAVAQHRGVIHDHVHGVALLAAGLDIFQGVERPQPVFIIAVRLLNTFQRHAVAAVAGRTAEFLRVVEPQQFGVGVADKDLLSTHIFGGDDHRFANAGVAGLATIDNAGIGIIDLPDFHRRHPPPF